MSTRGSLVVARESVLTSYALPGDGPPQRGASERSVIRGTPNREQAGIAPGLYLVSRLGGRYQVRRDISSLSQGFLGFDGSGAILDQCISTLPTDLTTSLKPSAPQRRTPRTPSATCRRTRR